jgi:hypothetical protein
MKHGYFAFDQQREAAHVVGRRTSGYSATLDASYGGTEREAGIL